MVSEEKVRAVATAFADALDRNDFRGAIAMLAPTCRYDRTAASLSSEGVLRGPAAIVESYRWHDARAQKLFDRVEYFSVVERVDGTTAVIRFSDLLEKTGRRMTYSCRQRVTVNEALLIDAIVQEDIPEETTALRRFLERVGVVL